MAVAMPDSSVIKTDVELSNTKLPNWVSTPAGARGAVAMVWAVRKDEAVGRPDHCTRPLTNPPLPKDTPSSVENRVPP